MPRMVGLSDPREEVAQPGPKTLESDTCNRCNHGNIIIGIAQSGVRPGRFDNVDRP